MLKRLREFRSSRDYIREESGAKCLRLSQNFSGKQIPTVLLC